MSSEKEEIAAFDAKVLEGLDLSEYGISFKDGFSPTHPEPNLFVRPLSNKDYDKGFTKVLAQLTKVGEVSKQDFLERFALISQLGTYYPLVIEDKASDGGRGKVVGTGTLEIEHKFIHSCATRGRLEEIVIDSEYRGRKLGKIMLGLVTELSKKLECYKTTLECKDEHIAFYGIYSYKKDPEHFMQRRFRD